MVEEEIQFGKESPFYTKSDFPQAKPERGNGFKQDNCKVAFLGFGRQTAGKMRASGHSLQYGCAQVLWVINLTNKMAHPSIPVCHLPSKIPGLNFALLLRLQNRYPILGNALQNFDATSGIVQKFRATPQQANARLVFFQRLVKRRFPVVKSSHDFLQLDD